MHFAIVPPVEITLLIVCVMELAIDRALTAIQVPTIRQQSEDAHFIPMILACTSTAPQLHLAGWAWENAKL